MFGGRARAREEARGRAAAARHDAALRFVEMEREARAVRDLLSECLTVLEPRHGRPLAERLRPPLERSDEMAKEWIWVEDQFRPRLEDERTDVQAVEGSRGAYEEVGRRLTDRLRELSDLHNTREQVTEAVRRRVAPVLRRQQQVLTVAAPVHERAERLLAEQPGLEALKSSLATSRAAVRLVETTSVRERPEDEIAALADEAEATVQSLRELGERYARTVRDGEVRLRALGSREEAARGKLDAADDALSELRRTFRLSSSADLDDVPTAMRRAVADAGEAMTEGRAAYAQGDVEALTAAIGAAEAHLDEAEALCRQPADRLERLRQVAADPDAAWERARFTVRDAQAMVVRAAVADDRDIAELDAASAQVAATKLDPEATHPDYLVYLTTLEQASARARDVVLRTRERLARGRAT